MFTDVRRYTLAILLFFFTCSPGCLCQVADSFSRFSQPVQLDSFVIFNGFDVNAFIARVRADTTFYKAFKSMRLIPYTAKNKILVFGKNGDTAASMAGNTRQQIINGCRTTVADQEQVTGDFYKRNHDYNYYTAKLFAWLFFAAEPQCNESDIVAGSLDVKGEGQMAKSEYQLKQLIFNPGSRVSGVPFMGSRESIFDPEEAKKYDFKIDRENFGGFSCYAFRIMPKPGYEHKVIYNELTTWFRVSDYTIVARDYSLSYHTLVYDFDVNMKVRTSQIGKKLYPTFISYDGNWHIFSQKRERVKFNISINY